MKNARRCRACKGTGQVITTEGPRVKQVRCTAEGCVSGYVPNKGYEFVPCDGEAHGNPYIDNCATCLPYRWGWVLCQVKRTTKWRDIADRTLGPEKAETIRKQAAVELEAEGKAELWVVMVNDYPDSIWTDEAEANTAAAEWNLPEGGVYVRARKVPVNRMSEQGKSIVQSRRKG